MDKDQPAQKQLLADEASIQERQVTVRVLTIGTKQVTQSLYRQLMRESVLDDTAQIRGDVWGWVNLHDTDNCKGQSKHLHVIYEYEGQLKQSILYASYEQRSAYHALQRNLEAKGRALVYATALEGRFFYLEGEKSYRNPFVFDVNGRRVKIYPDDSVYRLWKLPDEIQAAKQDLDKKEQKEDVSDYSLKWAREHHENKIGELSEVETKVKKLLIQAYLGVSEELPSELLPSSAEAYKAMEDVMDEIVAFETNHAKSYKTIENTGQLFIAVSGVWK